MNRRPPARALAPAADAPEAAAAPFALPGRLAAPVVGDSASPTALGRLNAALAEIRAHAVAPLLQQAVIHVQADRHREGADWALKALEVDEQNSHAWHILAICREKAADYASAMKCYERALELDPEDADLPNDLGRLAFRLQMPELAEKLFGHHLRRRPNSPEGVNNLACALRDQSRFADAIETLRPAIYAAPENPLLWNTLGTVLCESGDMAQAEMFFDEALRLDPAMRNARYNRVQTKLSRGDLDGALRDADDALKLARLETESAMMRLARSTVLLCMGELARGWEAYEARFDDHYADVLHFVFDIPEQPLAEDLAGRSLLVVGEQGLGDEVLFANVLPDVVDALGPEGQLLLGVERRLVPLFQRSFPDARVLPHSTGLFQHHSLRTVMGVEGAEAWAPMGQMVRRFRGSVAAFPDRHEGFLRADPERVEHWRRTLAEAAPGPKVGVLWKSLRMDASRVRFFSPFEQWASVLATPGVTFVNLQYGDCDEELARARDELGVELWRPPGIDLKDDLDDLAALTCALDLTVGPANATTNIAAACGAPVWLISTPGAWPRLGTERYPWYPQIRVFVRAAAGDWSGVMGEVSEALAAEFPAV